MSLQIAAQHLSSQGRGNDSMLVHMSPREVSSLNAIAKAHGGQLTTNPHTGLPEAGFLESLLPMVAGVGLTAISGGAINPMTAGLITGGLGYAMTGSLSKGLMMGLGAYGGAGLGESLAMQGVQAAAAPAAAELSSAGLAAQEAALAQQAQIAQQAALTTPVDLAKSGFSPAEITNLNAQTNALTPGHDALARAGANSGAQLQAVQNAALTPEAAKMQFANMGMGERFDAMGKGIGSLGKEGGFSNLYQNMGGNPMSVVSKVGSAFSPTAAEAMKPKPQEEEKADTSMGQRYAYSPGYVNPTPGASASGVEYAHLNPAYRKIDDTEAKKIYGFADGGATADPAAPPVPTSYTAAQPTTPISKPIPAFEVPEVNSLADLARAKESQRFIDAYLNRPAPIDVQAQYNKYLQNTLKAKPMAVANSGLTAAKPVAKADADSEYIYDANTQRYVKNPAYKDPEATKKKSKVSSFNPSSGMTPMVNFSSTNSGNSYNANRGRFAAGGGISHLGDYSDGGRLLRGPGDGVSDSIPAVIGKKQPARLADGEFVVPARIVSELGNGSTEAGARKLYAMMDRIQKARGKTVGKNKVAKNSRSEKYLPA